jgi:hypothetical protein
LGFVPQPNLLTWHFVLLAKPNKMAEDRTIPDCENENEDEDEDEKQSNRHFRRLPLESLLSKKQTDLMNKIGLLV